MRITGREDAVEMVELLKGRVKMAERERRWLLRTAREANTVEALRRKAERKGSSALNYDAERERERTREVEDASRSSSVQLSSVQ